MKLNYKHLTVLVLAWSISLSLDLTYVMANSTTSYLTVGRQLPYSMLWMDGSYCYAKNPLGHIDYSGTNACAVINNALTDNPSGVFLSSGTYNIGSASILINTNGSRLKGESPYTTIIQHSGSGDAIKINASSCLFCVYVESLTLQGNNQGYGIHAWGLKFGELNNLIINDFETAISLRATDTKGCWSNTMYNPFIDHCKVGVNLTGHDNFQPLRVNDVRIKGGSILGISKTETGSVGVYIKNGASNYIEGCNFEYWETALYVQYSGTTCIRVRMEGSTIGTGVRLFGYQQNIFIASTIAGDTAFNHTGGGANNQFVHIQYSVVEAYSYTNNVANGHWIQHTLLTTPTMVLLTPSSNTTVWLNDKNSTHFQVGVGSGTITLNWYAKYIP